LKVPEVVVAKFTVVCGDTLAIIRVPALLHLIDKITHCERVILGGTKNQCLLFLVDLLHEQLHPMRFTFFDFDDLVRVGFGIALSRFNLTLDDLINPAYKRIRRASQPIVLAKTTTSAPVKRSMSAAARRKIAAFQRARWAKVKAQQKKAA
jgi:hypothetical protein